MAGAQTLELAPLPPRVSISSNMKPGANSGNQTQAYRCWMQISSTLANHLLLNVSFKSLFHELFEVPSYEWEEQTYSLQILMRTVAVLKPIYIFKNLSLNSTFMKLLE